MALAVSFRTARVDGWQGARSSHTVSGATLRYKSEANINTVDVFRTKSRGSVPEIMQID